LLWWRTSKCTVPSHLFVMDNTGVKQFEPTTVYASQVSHFSQLSLALDFPNIEPVTATVFSHSLQE